jgi:hypothetical protein
MSLSAPIQFWDKRRLFSLIDKDKSDGMLGLSLSDFQTRFESIDIVLRNHENNTSVLMGHLGEEAYGDVIFYQTVLNNFYQKIVAK